MPKLIMHIIQIQATTTATAVRRTVTQKKEIEDMWRSPSSTELGKCRKTIANITTFA